MRISKLGRPLILIVFFYARLCTAQWINIGPGGDALSGVSFRSATEGWVCGANGALFHTTDGGTSWQRQANSFQTTGPHSRVMGVYTLVTGLVQNVVVLTQQPDSLLPTQVYYSYRNGGDFQPGFPSGVASGDFVHLSFHTGRLGLLTGARGNFRTSYNSLGASWDQVPSGTLNDLHGGDSPDGDTYYLVGGKGTLRKGQATLGGSSKALNSGTFARLTGVWFVDLQQGYVIGDSGTALRTTDGGDTWQPMAVGTTANLNAVRFLNATTGFIAGDLGTLLATTDGGKTWTPEASHTYETLSAIEVTADGPNVWVVGGSGIVLKRGTVVPLASRGPASALPWQVSPNPFTTSLTLTGPTSTSSSPTEVSLLDQLGRLVLHQTLGLSTAASPQHPLAVPSTLAPGIYTLRLLQPGQAPVSQRLVRLP